MDAIEYLQTLLTQIENDVYTQDELCKAVENYFKGLVVVPKKEYMELQEIGWMYSEVEK